MKTLLHSPVQPGRHLHSNLMLSILRQVPPFWHGSEEHGFRPHSPTKLKSNCFLYVSWNLNCCDWDIVLEWKSTGGKVMVQSRLVSECSSIENVSVIIDNINIYIIIETLHTDTGSTNDIIRSREHKIKFLFCFFAVNSQRHNTSNQANIYACVCENPERMFQ